ncbi:MAG: YgfZ/GcvT domain-containing protein [Acidimicrobiales bacterium]
MLSLEETYRAIRQAATWRCVPRDGLAVEGKDTHSWLQGQVSQDLNPVEVGGAADALVLSPQGRLVAACRLWRSGEERYVIETEEGFGGRLAERLEHYRLRVKAVVSPIGLTLLECRGPTVPSAPVGSAPVTWPGYGGFDVLSEAPVRGRLGPGEIEAVAKLWRGEIVEPGDGAGFEAARIEAGLPRLGRELGESTIAQEAGEGFVARSVSFTKGCYTGQELIARIDARGSNTPRRLRGVVLGEGSARVGDALVLEGSVVGEITSAAFSPGASRVVALAYVKRSVAMPASVSVVPALDGAGERSGQGAPAKSAEIRTLPLYDG